MEENTTVSNEEEVDVNANSASTNANSTTSSNEELEALKAELEKAKAETARFKSSVDKLTKEAAEKKREERAKMTEEEKRKAEQEEEYIRLKEKAESDAKELNHLKAVTAYKDINSDDIEKIIDAVNDKDHNAIAAMIEKIVEKTVREKEAEWKKSRPSAFIGDGSFPSMTKEEIRAIKDPLERQQKIAENINLFS